jgi:fructokinase
LNGYVRTPQIISGLNDYVVPPALGDDAGVLGAIALAQR